jgi:hypothetical protein
MPRYLSYRRASSWRDVEENAATEDSVSEFGTVGPELGWPSTKPPRSAAVPTDSRQIEENFARRKETVL